MVDRAESRRRQMNSEVSGVAVASPGSLGSLLSFQSHSSSLLGQLRGPLKPESPARNFPSATSS